MPRSITNLAQNEERPASRVSHPARCIPSSNVAYLSISTLALSPAFRQDRDRKATLNRSEAGYDPRLPEHQDKRSDGPSSAFWVVHDWDRMRLWHARNCRTG
jgi:hypothetical protein